MCECSRGFDSLTLYDHTETEEEIAKNKPLMTIQWSFEEGLTEC